MEEEVEVEPAEVHDTTYSSVMLYLGLGMILFVPLFKTITHLPPYVGMMLSLSVVATFAEIFSKAKINITSVDVDNDSHEMHSPVEKSLSKIV